jgi:hypothetical protein
MVWNIDFNVKTLKTEDTEAAQGTPYAPAALWLRARINSLLAFEKNPASIQLWRRAEAGDNQSGRRDN